MKKLLSFAVLSIALLSCSDGEQRASPAPESAEQPLVYATNYPLAYFAERISAGVAEVRLAVPTDGDPAYWSPGPDDVLALQGADLVVLNGASYESWLDTVSLPPDRIVVTTEGLEDRLVRLHEKTTHSHGPDGEHEHSGTAFTTWLDPTLAVEQAQAIKQALVARWPQHAERFEAELGELTGELTQLDAEAQQAVSGNPELPLLFSHPVYQYLTRRYALDARSVHWEPEQMPDEAAWQELSTIAAESRASWMIWEGTPLPEIRERLESIGIRSALFDPCARKPANGDFLSVMQQNLESLRVVFAEDGGAESPG